MLDFGTMVYSKVFHPDGISSGAIKFLPGELNSGESNERTEALCISNSSGEPCFSLQDKQLTRRNDITVTLAKAGILVFMIPVFLVHNDQSY